MKKYFTIILLFASAIFAQTAHAQQTSPSYKLRPMDVIQMSVFQEPELSNIDARIVSDGTIILPLIGKVQIAGLTLIEAQQKITALYEKDYLQKPQVSLFIREYAKQSCYVLGFVARPCEYEFPREEADKMTITRVIAGCNGFSPRANRRAVLVKRKLENGKEELFTINVREILTDQAPDFPIKNGDIIEVKEDII
ncbi:polysaccharide biosynthesis/export family protein [Intestinicryptomonas porci]|uniref:Polysaccharide export protein n=1 Tax=Intestinicryptomonas porci TaxID=2926320 RepID=A0ABU4WFF5_9BACT|nr:polysaccharide export protein [Opitutales bacterium CLA-KB-P66]